jgi:hypothetical protein
VFGLERKSLNGLEQGKYSRSFDELRRSPEMLPLVEGGISNRAVVQSNEYASSHEISDRLEDGWSMAGANSTFRADGSFNTPGRRPAVVIDRQNDPILSAAINEAKQQFGHLPPRQRAEALTKWSRELLTPGNISGSQLDDWYDQFSKVNDGKRIFFGEFIREGKGVCSQQAILLKVLADEFPDLNVKLVRGNSYNSPPGSLNHAWTEFDFGDGKPLIYDPRQRVYGRTYKQYQHTPGRDMS